MGITKRLDEARKAYARGDKRGSEAAHEPERIAQAAVQAMEGIAALSML